MTTTTIQTAANKFVGRGLLTSVLALGPLASVMILSHYAGASWLPLEALHPVLLGVLFMWSPMPVSIPALCLQRARDTALPEYRGFAGSMLRGMRLVGYLMVSKSSPVRAEMTASVLGFLAAVVWVLG